MEVHLAINPLRKDTDLLDSKMETEDEACANNASCEPKLVILIRELSDIEHSWK